jgi:hypothetical protein
MGKSVDDLTVEIVYLPKGVSTAETVDIVGRVVCLEGLASPITVKAFAELGAIGAIFINGHYTHNMIVSPIWGNPTPETAHLLPSISVVSVNEETGAAIKEKLKHGETTAVLSTQVDTYFRPIPTLTAEIKGSEEPEKFVLFSGHIDSWHYGAMDNGTANAVMMEVARILSKQKGQFKRTLRIAFWSGHSHGRYAGSAHYCDTHWADLRENCVIHINIDSVGAKDANVLSEGNSMAETKMIAKDVIGNLRGQQFEGRPFGRFGDQSFWGTGIPSLFMSLSEQEYSDSPVFASFAKIFNTTNSGGPGWWWHTTEDTLDKIDPDNLKRDCGIYLLTILRMLNDLILPIDQVEAVAAIEKSLAIWQEKAGTKFDLYSSLELVRQLKQAVLLLQAKSVNVLESQTERVKIINEALMNLSRLLVPLQYLKNDIYTPDLALPYPFLPKFLEIDHLVQVESNTKEYNFLQTSLLRKKNEVDDTLRQAYRYVLQVPV